MRVREMWFMDDAASDDVADWTALPELKVLVQPFREGDSEGFRGLLDDPDTFSNLGCCGETRRPRQCKTARKTRLVSRLHERRA